MSRPVPVQRLDEPTRESLRKLFRERGVQQAWVTTDYDGADEACFIVSSDDAGDLDITVHDFVSPPDLEDMCLRIADILPHQKIIVFGSESLDNEWSGRIEPL